MLKSIVKYLLDGLDQRYRKSKELVYGRTALIMREKEYGSVETWELVSHDANFEEGMTTTAIESTKQLQNFVT